MKQFEQEFEKHIEALSENADAGCVFVYTELVLHFFFGSDFAVRDRVNPHAGFWNGILGALQSAGFMALGRMYDQDGSDHTIRALLDFAEGHTGIFQASALEARKVAAGALPLAEAKAYAADAFELKKGGLTHLRKEFEKHYELYRLKVQPIRHSVFAHAGRVSRADRDSLFTNLFLRELEAMAVFPILLHRALFDLYHNGREPLLESPATIVTDVLKAAPDDSTSTWEHLHVAKNAKNFVAWLRHAPLPNDRRLREWAAAIDQVIDRSQD